MNDKLKNTPIGLIATSVLLLVLVVLFSIQMTLGRYMTTINGEFGFASASKQSVSLTHGEWNDGTAQKTLAINLSPVGSTAGLPQGSAVRIRLYVPWEIYLSSVKIEIDTKEYIADISSVPVGTAVYNSYGDGNICRFYEADGKELSFDILDLGDGGLDATLTLISIAEFNTEGIKIITEPIQVKGGN